MASADYEVYIKDCQFAVPVYVTSAERIGAFMTIVDGL